MKLYQVDPTAEGLTRGASDHEMRAALGDLADWSKAADPAELLPALGYKYGGGRVSGAFERRARGLGFRIITQEVRGGVRLLFERRPI